MEIQIGAQFHGAGVICVAEKKSMDLEGGATRGTTALVYYCIHSSLYTRTVQGC
jgi:hypothetical protein